MEKLSGMVYSSSCAVGVLLALSVVSIADAYLGRV
jgi:hypothetical protein